MATYPQPFLKLTFGGQLAQGQDEWNCGINLSITNDALVPITGIDAEDAFDLYTEEMQDDMIDIFTSYMKDPIMQIPSGASLDYVKLALIGTDGLYMREPHIWEVTDVSGSVNNSYVPQVSLVMTLQSDKFRDPGKYSRFYLPTISPITPGGYRPQTTAGKADRTAALISVLNRRVTSFNRAMRIRPAAVTSSPKFEGEYRPITRVKVGNVFDTQRRRRNKIAEIYSETLVPEEVPVEETP